MRQRYADDPTTFVVDELGLCMGAARVDVAVVNGSVHGYEIKSPRDTLARLPRQADIYGQVLDYVTIVAAEGHAEAARSTVPDWWGVWCATEREGTIRLRQIRKGRRNPAVDPLAIAQLLWRDEALGVLSNRGLAAGLASKPRREIWRRLAQALPLEDLRKVVRDALKSRPPHWRAGETQV